MILILPHPNCSEHDLLCGVTDFISLFYHEEASRNYSILVLNRGTACLILPRLNKILKPMKRDGEKRALGLKMKMKRKGNFRLPALF